MPWHNTGAAAFPALLIAVMCQCGKQKAGKEGLIKKGIFSRHFNSLIFFPWQELTHRHKNVNPL